MAEQPQPGPGGVHSGKPEPSVRDVFGGPGAGEAADALMREEVVQRARRLRQSGISRIFERASGGVKLGAKEAFRLTSAIVSRANVKVFGQNLAGSLDYALHHKKEMVTDAVQYAIGHKGEIAFGAVGGQIGKTAARAVLTGTLAGTGGFLGGAVIGAAGGALAGAAKEYFKQREGMQINETEKTLIIAGLKNEFRRIKAADKDEIRKAALRGAIIGAVGGVIGVGITDFVANNEWVQEQISKIRLPEIKLPEVKLPQFEGAAPSVPSGFAPDFPAPESPPVAEATPVVTPRPIAVPAFTVEAPAAAPPAVPTAEATATPTASPTGTPIPTETPTPVPTGTPTAGATPEPAAAVPPPAPAPEPPAGPSRILHPTAPTGASELAAAPPAPPVTAEPAAAAPSGTEPVIAQPAAPAAPVEVAPVELAALPEQIPLPAGSNPWEVTSRTLRDVLGRDPTSAEILQVTKEVCRQSNIAVPNWDITGEIDHNKLPVNYKLVFNDPVKKLIAGMKG